MKKNTVKLNEAQLRKLVAETISEIADSNGYYEILNYLHDIKGTPDGARILDGLYGESAMGEENAIAELKEIFPEAHPKAIEAAIWDFKREMEGDDEYSMVMESKVKKAVRESIEKVLSEKQFYDDEDELDYRKKKMRNWAGTKKFHDDNDKRIAELEKAKAERERKKEREFSNRGAICGRPSKAK